MKQCFVMHYGRVNSRVKFSNSTVLNFFSDTLLLQAGSYSHIERVSNPGYNDNTLDSFQKFTSGVTVLAQQLKPELGIPLSYITELVSCICYYSLYPVSVTISCF